MKKQKYNFEDVAKIYLSPTAKPLEMEEYTHRGCKCWVFKRRVNKWRPTAKGLWGYHQNKYEYKDIPETEKEYYIDEFWMGISDYFMKYACELELTIEKEIGECMDKEEAKYRLNYWIDENYAEYISTEKIP